MLKSFFHYVFSFPNSQSLFHHVIMLLSIINHDLSISICTFFAFAKFTSEIFQIYNTILVMSGKKSTKNGFIKFCFSEQKNDSNLAGLSIGELVVKCSPRWEKMTASQKSNFQE